MTDKRRVAIIGGSECGKTSVAVSYSKFLWDTFGLRTLAFDPWLRENPHRWGAHAWATDEFDKFEHVVFKVKNCVVFWDEGSSTGGRDRENVKFFTAIRHQHPAFFFMGHDFAAMLPIMRNSLTDLVLFRSDAKEAEKWAEKFTDREIMRATTLPQYAFLHKRAFKPAAIREPDFADLKLGVPL